MTIYTEAALYMFMLVGALAAFAAVTVSVDKRKKALARSMRAHPAGKGRGTI